MRNQLVVSVLSMLAALVVMISPAVAQYGSFVQPRGIPGYASSPVSPYINLTQRGTNSAINYYGLVRPTVNFQNSMLGLQQQLSQTNTQLNATDQALMSLPETGHVASFMNYGHYYGGGGLSLGRGSSSSTANRGTSGKSAATTGGYTR